MNNGGELLLMIAGAVGVSALISRDLVAFLTDSHSTPRCTNTSREHAWSQWKPSAGGLFNERECEVCGWRERRSQSA